MSGLADRGVRTVSFFAAFACSLLRGLLIVLLGVPIAQRLRQTLAGGGDSGPGKLWLLVLLPLFLPGLLIGYGYRNFSLSLVHHPLWNEVIYGLIVLQMVVPIGTLILCCAPVPPLSLAGVHVRRLALAEGGVNRWTQRLSLAPFWVRSRLFAVLPAGAAMFLLTFQETEVAALMQARGWPEWMFTRLAAGLTITEALAKLLWPIVLQLLLLAVVLHVVNQSVPNRSVSAGAADPDPGGAAVAWIYALAALVVLLIIPGGIVLRGTQQGFAVVVAHPDLLRQISIGLMLGVTAGGMAWVLSGWLLQWSARRGNLLLAVVPMIPGMMGPWALGLLLAVGVTQPGIRPLADTPVPMIVGEALYQLPRALLIRLLLGQARSSTTVHWANLLLSAPDQQRRTTGADLVWHLDLRGRAAGLLIVCYWAYMELSIPSPALLAPPGMTTAPVLLYNQMHYSQIPGLSALLLVTLSAPVVSLIVTSLGARYVRAWWRRT